MDHEFGVLSSLSEIQNMILFPLYEKISVGLLGEDIYLVVLKGCK